MRKLTQEEAVSRMTEARPDYDYSKFEYAGSSAKSIVICSKHGGFSTSYEKIMGRHGCPSCKNDLTGARRALSQGEAVRRMMLAKPEFDYSKFVYKSAAIKGVVVCPTHGEFLSSYAAIFGGHGCPKCKGAAVTEKRTFSQETALRKMKAVAPQYDYAKFVYEGSDSKSTVICKKHGVFQSSMGLITAGRGCKKCGIESRTGMRTMSQDDAVHRMSAAHPDLDFSKFVYVKSFSKSEVVCAKHGSFQTTYNSAVTGHGCKKCSFENAAINARIPFKEFVIRARRVHGATYSYSEKGYNGIGGSVLATCSKHGGFIVNCEEHIRGQNCPDCKDTKFNPKKKAYLYLCLVEKENDYVLGYGITGNILRRKQEHVGRLAQHGYNVVFLDVFKFNRGYFCREAENQIKTSFPIVSLPVRGFKSEATNADFYVEIKEVVSDFHAKYGAIHDFDFYAA